MNIPCVTSAEMTQISTTATMRHRPDRYLRLEPMSAGRQAGSPHVRSSLACTTEKYGEKGGRVNNLKPRSASPHHLAWPPGGGHTRAVREPRRLGIRLASRLTERAGRGGGGGAAVLSRREGGRRGRGGVGAVGRG